jgi:4-amino-4-deoxy-L-arabinose transferase-like glycosyltransferase
MTDVATVSVALPTRRAPAPAHWTVAALVGAVALVARAAYWAFATPDRPLLSDASQYHFLAVNLAEGRGYVDTFPQIELHQTAYRPPVYPFVLSLAYRLLGPHEWVGRALNLVIGVAVVVVLALLIDRYLGRRAALVGGLVAALMPNLIANDTYVLTEPLSLLLLVVLLWMVLANRWLWAGVVAGTLVLTRPSAQYLAVVLAVWLLSRVGWRRAVGFLAVTGLVMAPWLVRNRVELGSPVLVTSNGFNFAAMYSPPAAEVGAFIDPVNHPYFDEQRLDQFDEVVWDRHLRESGLNEMKAHPWRIPQVMARNAVAYTEIRSEFNATAESLDGRNDTVKTLTVPLFYAFLVAGLAGWWRLRRESLVIGAAVLGGYFTVASLMFVAPPRLRSPLDLMLCIGVAALAAGPARGGRLVGEAEPVIDLRDGHDDPGGDEAEVVAVSPARS